MNRINLICVLLCGFFASAVLAQDDQETIVTIDLSQSRAHVGDNVTFICRITNMESSGDMYWFKTVFLDRTKPEDLHYIANDDNKIPPFNKFDRYVTKSEWQGSDRVFSLKIYGVTVEDTGHVGCSYGDIEDNNFEHELFEVYDDIDTIKITLNDTAIEVAAIEAVAEEPLVVKIEVGDSVPAPHIKVLLGEEDISRNFSFHAFTETKCEDGSLDKCPIHFSQMTKGEASKFMFKPEDSGKALNISAVVPGSGFKHMTKSYAIQLQHKPIYACQTNVTGVLGEPVTLSCKVRASPKLDYVYWFIPKGDKMITIDVMTGVAPKAYTVGYRPVPDPKELRGTVEVSLSIFNIQARDLQAYTLFAGNGIANTTQVMHLSEKVVVTEPSNAILVSASITLLFAAFLSAMNM